MPKRSKRRKLNLAALSAISMLWISGCGLLKEKEQPDAGDISQLANKPLSPEETKELLGQVSENWWYGQGVGGTALNVGAIVAFPPYAAYLAANGLLSVSGYEPLEITSALPPEAKAAYDETYKDLTSGPGRFNAAVAGEEFHTEAVAKEKLEPYLKRTEPSKQAEAP